MLELRQLADYSPHATFTQINVESLIDEAESAMRAFERIEPVEKTDLLALLLVRPR